MSGLPDKVTLVTMSRVHALAVCGDDLDVCGGVGDIAQRYR